jgi:cardiolipin synthase
VGQAPVDGGDGAAGGAQPPAAPEPPRQRLTFKRLSGLDRSGPPQPATLAGAPLNPWTIPNAIGFFRIALIPVFLVVALSSEEGIGFWPAFLFGVIGWGDYADGIAARVTRQYSRLGALMDPVTDRLLVIAGVIVCWNFELLPRWAIAVLVARELAMLVIAQWGLRHGIDLAINWPGRLAVAPVMGGLFFPMTGLGTLGEVLLYIGLALALTATALYLRSGLAQLRARDAAGGPEGGPSSST